MTSSDVLSNLSNAAMMETNIIRVSPTTSLREALCEMTRAKTKYAIIEDDGKFVGLLCDRDLRFALPSRLDSSVDIRKDLYMENWRVAQVCIRRPYTVPSGGSAAVSARMMLEKDVGCLPVLNEAGEVLGILMLRDFARVFAGVASERRTARSFSSEPLAVAL